MARRFNAFPANSLPDPLAGKVLSLPFSAGKSAQGLDYKRRFLCISRTFGLRGDFSRIFAAPQGKSRRKRKGPRR
jgi:hypothetical protein